VSPASPQQSICVSGGGFLQKSRRGDAAAAQHGTKLMFVPVPQTDEGMVLPCERQRGCTSAYQQVEATSEMLMPAEETDTALRSPRAKAKETCCEARSACCSALPNREEIRSPPYRDAMPLSNVRRAGITRRPSRASPAR